MSVPVLPFHDGKEVRSGDSVAAVATTLGRAAEVGRQEVDRGSLGERLTRFYEYAGARFILVFEPFERNGEPGLRRSTCRSSAVRTGSAASGCSRLGCSSRPNAHRSNTATRILLVHDELPQGPGQAASVRVDRLRSVTGNRQAFGVRRSCTRA